MTPFRPFKIILQNSPPPSSCWGQQWTWGRSAPAWKSQRQNSCLDANKLRPSPQKGAFLGVGGWQLSQGLLAAVISHYSYETVW